MNNTAFSYERKTNSKKIKIRSLTKILLIILTLTITGIAGTFAYFESTVLVSSNYRAESYSNVVRHSLANGTWIPGSSIDVEELNVTNTGTVSIAVRAWIEETISKESTNLDNTLDTGEDVVLKAVDDKKWVYDGDKYYYYTTVLNTDEQTSNFIEKLTFNKEVETEVICVEGEDNVSSCSGSTEGYDDSLYTLTVHFDTMQVDGVEEKWNISLDTVGRTTIYLDAAEGALAETEKTLDLVYGSPYGTLPEPTSIKTGYSFLGWYTKDGKEILESSIVSKEDGDTLVAKYGANTYKLIYDTKGGEALKSKNVSYESFYGELPTPTRIGYRFLGWYKEDSYTNEVTEKTKFWDTSDITIYAKWEANSYTITYKANGGTVDQTTQTFSYDSTYTNLPTPTLKGHTFAGWYTDTSFEKEIKNGDTVKITSDTSLFAKWDINKYEVSFDTDGGSSVPKKEVYFNSTYGELSTPTKAGHTFLKWQDESGNQITSTSVMTIDRNHTLTAVWQVESYETIFYANGGTIEGTAATEERRTIAYGSKYGTLPTASLTGHDFAGWFTETNGGEQITKDSVMNSTTGISLYAHYTPKVYIVNFDGNEGTADKANITVTYGGYYGTLPGATRTGYTFEGWFTEKSGGTQVGTNTNVNITMNQTLYAHWKAIPYEVNIVATNTTVTETKFNVNYDGGKTITITPKSEYYLLTATCTNGYSAVPSKGTGTGATGMQEITILNKGHTGGSTCTLYSRPVKTFYEMMASKAQSDASINLGAISSDTNGKGIYRLTKVSGLTEPIYYYRGAVNNNVIFAGFCWKIIRTTDTKGTKLIYNGTPNATGQCVETGRATTLGLSKWHGETSTNVSYAGYTVNGGDSVIKGVVDAWYVANKTKFDPYLEDTPFYNEKNGTTLNGSSVRIGFPAGMRIWGYSGGNASENVYSENVPKTTVILGKGVSKEDTYMMDNVRGNGLLKYPVGLITSDEAVLAGARGYISGTNVGGSDSYLSNGEYFWTMSPDKVSSEGGAHVICIGTSAYILNWGWVSQTTEETVRPVISLKEDSGYSNNGAPDGSSAKPYVVLE